jgi:hypothetical protein
MDDTERIRDEHKQLKDFIDRNYQGSPWNCAKAIGMPFTTLRNYITPRQGEPQVDLRKIKLASKRILYDATQLEFLNPAESLPKKLNDWQFRLYNYMVENKKGRAEIAAIIGVKLSTFNNYLQEPIRLEYLRNAQVRENIQKLLYSHEAPAEQPAQQDTKHGLKLVPNAGDEISHRVEEHLAAISHALPCIFADSNAGITKGTAQLVDLLNTNLERYCGNTQAQEILRKDRQTLELFARCHELLSAIYQNDPFTAHRLKTKYQKE